MLGFDVHVCTLPLLFFQACDVTIVLSDETNSSYVVTWTIDPPECQINVTEVQCSCVDVTPADPACEMLYSPEFSEEDMNATCTGALAGRTHSSDMSKNDSDYKIL